VVLCRFAYQYSGLAQTGSMASAVKVYSLSLFPYTVRWRVLLVNRLQHVCKQLHVVQLHEEHSDVRYTHSYLCVRSIITRFPHLCEGFWRNVPL
jgi:hypothetical protein